jgi:signal transduction histidine kinase
MNGEDIPGYFEMIIIKKDGTEVPIELTSAYTQYEGERANVAFIRDITERKQAEDRERQLQEELALSSRLASIGELAAGVAHELNNPLTAVIGYSERLLRNNYDRNTISSLEKINSEALRVSKVIDNLITFARRREPKREYSDINTIVRTALELRAYELKTSNIEVEVELAEDLPEVIADFHQIEQVFLNIILNAEQAMTETQNGGKLIIRTKRLKNSIRISFTDNGPGIPEENIDKIFDPFFTTRGNKDGTGLGLSICHGIVQEHDGKICARSKPGKGTTFNIEIPLKTRKRKNKKTPQEVLS